MFEVTARLTVRPGELEGFRRQAAEMMRLTEELDTKTVRYDWFLSDDETECEVREAYVDADALIEHAQHIGEARNTLFRDFAARYPGDALVEDATFLEASALGRSGDWPSAIRAATLHLARFPRSFHGREAAALIARGVRADRSPGAVERCRAASAAVAPWASDPEIRAAIDACPPAP